MPDPVARVVLLATGGTVATTTRPDGRTAPTLGSDDLVRRVSPPNVEVVTRELERTPSWALKPGQMASIALAARDAAHEPGIDGVVVTHGTSTLEYTAFLADLVLDVEIPVVLTGAMRRADDRAPDGPRNLADAVCVAASESARGKGALVVFAGRVIPADATWKAQRTADDALVALRGDLGRVRAGTVEIGSRAWPRLVFTGRLEERVAFVKVVPGMGGDSIDSAVERGVRGLVIEALPGAGGLPPTMTTSVAAAASRIPVVIASRAPFGRLPDEPTGGTGEPLLGLGLLSAVRLTAEQAWLLLMAALADGADAADVRRRFAAVARDVNGNP
jgi:L-asparaginase